ncbi:hypothetical protein [Dyella nitratireducens]|nr:hypothetical protein [Dyella nitratireducens]
MCIKPMVVFGVPVRAAGVMFSCALLTQIKIAPGRCEHFDVVLVKVCPMAPIDEAVDFYIVMFRYASIERDQWLICARPTSHCLAVHEDRASAIAHAHQMAEYRVSAGKAAQIHVQQGNVQSWKTIWCSAGSAPKHP